MVTRLRPSQEPHLRASFVSGAQPLQPKEGFMMGRFTSGAVFLAVLGVLSFGFGQTAEAASGRAQVVTDQASGAVRVLVDGNEVVRIDSTGLHVHGDVEAQSVTAAVVGDGGARFFADDAGNIVVVSVKGKEVLRVDEKGILMRGTGRFTEKAVNYDVSGKAAAQPPAP